MSFATPQQARGGLVTSSDLRPVRQRGKDPLTSAHKHADP